MKLKSLLHHLNHRSTRIFPRLNSLVKFTLIASITIGLVFFVKNIIAADNTGTTTKTKTVDITEMAKNYKNKEEAIYTGSNQESWVYESLASNFMAINNALAGTIPEDVFIGHSTVTGQSTIWIPGGIIGATQKATIAMYTPPASGVEYIAQSVNSFFGKPAYAEDPKNPLPNGFGFGKLQGILNLWKLFRNAVYGLISLVFISIGIMIMLRVKISPQASVTVQSSIPKLITTLILVTFSYAIAGLIIDFSYVIMGLAISLIKPAGEISTLIAMDFNSFTWNYLGQMINGGLLWGLGLLLTIIFGILGGLSGGVGGAILGVISGGTIILFFIVKNLLKFFLGLAKCYITLLVKIITGPLEIGMGSIPGSKTNFSSWFIGVVANVAVFPISIIFIVFAIEIIETISGGFTTTWVPNLLPIASQYLKPILGMVCLSILAKLPDTVPEAIFSIKPSPFTKGVDQDYAKFGAKTYDKTQKKYKMGLVGLDTHLGPGTGLHKWLDRRQNANKL